MKNATSDELQVTSWEEADQAMLQLAQADAELQDGMAHLNADIAKVHERYQQPLNESRECIQALEKALRKFAMKHRREFRAESDGGRSHEHAGVVMGFRLTTPAVRIEDEAKATEWLTKFQEGIYIRTKVEPDRAGLLEVLKYDSEPVVEKLAAHGITLQQKDKFFLEVKEQK